MNAEHNPAVDPGGAPSASPVAGGPVMDGAVADGALTDGALADGRASVVVPATGRRVGDERVGDGPASNGRAGEPAADSVAGYTLVLPPGWRRIPVRRGSNAAIKKILDQSFRHLPRDQVAPYRAEIERRLDQMVAEARKNGGVDLYLPVELRNGTPVAASFVVSEVSFASVEHVEPALIVSELARGDDGSRSVAVDGTTGVRTEHAVPAAPNAEFPFGSRRVEYLVPVPGDADRWLAVVFSTPGAGDPGDQFALLLVELFDAVMSTFRWTRASGGRSGARSE